MPRGSPGRRGEAGRRNGGGPWYIKHGSDCPTVGQVTASPSTVAGLPFDGFVVDGVVNSVSSNVFSATTVSLANCTASLAGMAAAKPSFGENNRYFLRILNLNNLDWWNDTTWSTIAANFGNVANAAAAEGFAGLCFDPEFYGTGISPFNWGGSTPSTAFGDSGTDNPTGAPGTGADPTHNLAASRTKVQARGKQVMDAVLAQWPTVKILSLHGPYVSMSDTGAYFDAEAWYGNVAFANELMGTFVGGFIESIDAAGWKATHIDGGEIYGARTLGNFAKVNDWRLRDIKNSTSAAVSPAVKALLGRQHMGIGVEELDILSAFAPFTASQWQTLLTYAGRHNSWVWSYTETKNWWGGSFPATPVDSTWRAAAAAGRAAGKL